ncbi:MAG: hypothetical protein K6G92_02670 [Bacteroidaceae bacterium]|nr:hypothetical protein [Bacteroidaceae bacterium]
MNSDENDWKVGDIDGFPWTSTIIKKSGSTTYKHYYNSRFICIREAGDGQSGILVKVLGKTSPHDIMLVGGEPFCKDERDDLLTNKVYSSFRFPTLQQLTEALAVIRENPSLMSVFDETSMHFDTESSFWVRETSRKLLIRKKPQFYDASTGTLCVSQDDTPHYRLSMLYFQNGRLMLK